MLHLSLNEFVTILRRPLSENQSYMQDTPSEGGVVIRIAVAGSQQIKLIDLFIHSQDVELTYETNSELMDYLVDDVKGNLAVVVSDFYDLNISANTELMIDLIEFIGIAAAARNKLGNKTNLYLVV